MIHEVHFDMDDLIKMVRETEDTDYTYELFVGALGLLYDQFANGTDTRDFQEELLQAYQEVTGSGLELL